MRLLFLLLPACVDYDLTGKDETPGDTGGGSDNEAADPAHDGTCALQEFPAEAVPATDVCDYDIGGFEPVVEWGVEGEWSTALPVVGDLDGDGLPEIVVVFGSLFGGGELAAYHGDGIEMWRNDDYNFSYGSAPALADLDGDGVPEIVATLSHGTGNGFSIAAFDPDGDQLWESDAYTDGEFNWATGVVVSDMDHDGSPEIVAGRVIFNADGTQLAEGRDTSIGCSSGFGTLCEGAHVAVVDLDLDGEEEVVTGDIVYDIHGSIKVRGDQGDGGVAIANLDDDPEGEWVATSGNSIRAMDTDGTLLWGPVVNRQANIFSVPAVGDVDADGEAEILVAGGDELWALERDGTLLWTAPAHDQSGATGAAVFDFDADGIPEVVYIDEQEMMAVSGLDGTVLFRSREHSSATMYDYPVVADIDGDGHTEVIIASQGTYGLAVFQDATNSWAPARAVWNQHAYSITNIEDDLSVPVTATPNFTVYNNWHSALAVPAGTNIGDDLTAEILDICEDDCDAGYLRVWARGDNGGSGDMEPGLALSLYGMPGDVLLGTEVTSAVTPSEMSTDGVEFVVEKELLDGITSLEVRVDDDGTGTGAVYECAEDNNAYAENDGGWCE